MRKFIFLFILLFCSCEFIFAQNSVSGKVFYEKSNGTKEPLEFASVSWVEGNTVVSTNSDGLFTINNIHGETITLIASFIGYTKDTIILKEGVNYAEFNITDEKNSLNSVTITGKREGNYLSKGSTMKTEVISAAGLCKMACCSLAESFESTASVSVGYSDAVSGAKQIKLLGLSGIYTQMLDENRPVMRGLESPFALTYVPGQWLESIQIAKGPSSVINGLEAITGQINMEHRKPTAEQPLYLNLFTNSNLRMEGNIASSLQLNNKLSTVVMAHVSNDNKKHDGNKDGFMDEPVTKQFNVDNRWLYIFDNNAQLRFGIKALSDLRLGGQMDFKKGMNDEIFHEAYNKQIWGSQIDNRGVSGYVKLGIPLSEDQRDNIAFVLDYSYYKMKSSFGTKYFDGHQNMGFFNVMYKKGISEQHNITFGLNAQLDDINAKYKMYGFYSPDHIFNFPEQEIDNDILGRNDKLVGGYGEYTYDTGDKLTIVAGLRADYHSSQGWLFAPRANVKYSFNDNLVLRLNAGRGYRMSDVITDNLGVLSCGRKLNFEENIKIEEAWTFGGNITQHFKLGAGENSYISFDYFRSQFDNQVIIDWDKDISLVSIYNCHGKSFTDTYQLDLSIEPIERFTTMLTFRYTNAKVFMDGRGLVNRPLTSKYKGVLNLQYATPMNKWTFDFTAQLNGPVELPQFMGGDNTSIYPMLYAQITKKFRSVDVYAGVENITNYKQKNPILAPDKPFSQQFNAAMVWGPLMGRMAYIGMRFTLWKN